MRVTRPTFRARCRVNACLQALGRGHMLVQVIEDLVQALPDVGVLLDLGLELVKQRGVDQGRRHLGLLFCGGVCIRTQCLQSGAVQLVSGNFLMLVGQGLFCMSWKSRQIISANTLIEIEGKLNRSICEYGKPFSWKAAT